MSENRSFFFNFSKNYIDEKMCSPMPTCASRIMLTSLAPSPIAKVMGCSLEALISFTICQKKAKKRIKHHQDRVDGMHREGALRSPEPSAAAPCDSTARRCSCGRFLEKYLCSCPARRLPGWALALRTAWPRRWSDRSPNSPLTTWTTARISHQQEAAHTGRRVHERSVLPRDGALSDHRPVQLKEHIVQTLFLRAFLGQLEDLGAAAEQFAGVAGGSGRLHLVPREDPDLHPCLVQGLDGVGCLLLEPAHR